MGAPTLEKIRGIKIHQCLVLAVLSFGFASCGSKYLKVEDPQKLDVDGEFSQSVQIVVPETPEEGIGNGIGAGAGAAKEGAKSDSATGNKLGKAQPVTKTAGAFSERKKQKTSPKTVSVKSKSGKVPSGPMVHEPELEDSEGFLGRRPLKDPFWVGEKVIHDVSYFKVSAGKMTFAVGPYATVNGKKVYNFSTALETYPKFSSLVYAVDDKVVTFLDFDLLIPRVFTLHVRETGQRKEARSIFDFEKMQATYWEKKVTEEKGAEEKKQSWEIHPFSQNVFSAIFYMRLFKWTMGKEYSFRVADDGENIIFKGTAVRREILKTDIGDFPAVVVKPEITVKGVFKPMGDIFIWLSDDDRRLVLRIESKIKIGTLVSEVIQIEHGTPPQ